MKRIVFCIIICIIISLFLFSCAGVGHKIGGPTTVYGGQYYIELPKVYSKIEALNAVTSIAKDIFLNITEIDSATGKIVLSSGASQTSAMIIGKVSFQKIEINVIDNKKLDVKITVSGNFKRGTKKNGDKLFNNFKKQLLKNLE